MKNGILETITVIAFVLLIVTADSPWWLRLPSLVWLILFTAVNAGPYIMRSMQEAWEESFE